MSGIADSIASLGQKIADIPSVIIDKLTEWWDTLKEFLQGIWDGIASIPNAIGAILQDIFIPDTNYIDTAFKDFTEEMRVKFNFDTDFFENLFSSEAPVEDTYMDYNLPGVGNFHFKVFDTKFFVDGVSYFRPFIRGFLVLMMMLYHIRQLVGFFGYNAGVVPGRNEQIETAKKG